MFVVHTGPASACMHNTAFEIHDYICSTYSAVMFSEMGECGVLQECRTRGTEAPKTVQHSLVVQISLDVLTCEIGNLLAFLLFLQTEFLLCGSHHQEENRRV